MATELIAGAVLETRHARLVLAGDGTVAAFIDKRSGKDRLDHKAAVPFASVTRGGKTWAASKLTSENGRIRMAFGDSGVEAMLKTQAFDGYITLEVDMVSMAGEKVESIAFGSTAIQPDKSADPFVCCSLALNLKTNVTDIPGANERTGATCHDRFGLIKAKTAIVACPRSRMRKVLQDAVSAAPDIPHTPVGGPWALDAEITRGSYLFNFGGLSEANVDQWINLAKTLGMNQIDFHGGNSFRFGDCRPNPETYPNGRASLKAVIDRLHAAGIKAGLHTYAHFIDKSCPWVTPVPDPRLGKDATFTLAEALPVDGGVVPVEETTEKMSTITGFFERNSVTLQIDDELITYTGVSKQPPYGFTGCTRGACGTKVVAHEKGAKVHHLKECFGLFAPDGDSTLLEDVAAATADTFNECGFDMMYLDALDGEDVLGGWQNAWHYGSKFVFEIVKRTKKPPLMEMSTFHHHLWFVRSRIGAMDYPARSQKRFIDIHCGGNPHVVHAAGNTAAEKMFLPAELGWWTVHTAEAGPQVERTFPDDIEYLMCRCMATNTGFALIGIDPDTIKNVPLYQRLAPIFRNYEDLRHANYFPESVRKKLGVPGAEHTLEQSSDGKWQLRPVQYAKHKAEGSGGQSVAWTSANKFAKQPLKARIEALWSAGPYDSADAQVLSDWSKFTERESATGIKADLAASAEHAEHGPAACFTATSTLKSREGSWTKAGTVFSPALDLSAKQGLGVWVHGDGQGEILNVQVRSPKHLAWGIKDHYISVDFTGWRYFELVEPEGGRINDYTWPYQDDIYGIYRERVNYASVETLSLWYNNLPPGKEVKCWISPVKALPLVKSKLTNPRLTIAGKTITFPVDMESGSSLEFRSMDDCKVYGARDEVLAQVKPTGDIPDIGTGPNRIEFACNTPAGVSGRAWVTVISQSAQALK